MGKREQMGGGRRGGKGSEQGERDREEEKK